MANKAHNIVNVFSRRSIRNQKPQTLKSVPTSKAEEALSPMSQADELPEPEAEVPKAESMSKQGTKNEVELVQEKESHLLFPWEYLTTDGETKENIVVKERILELAIYRRTFVEPAEGEEEYVFNYATLKNVARELLLSNPNLREKRETLVEAVPSPVVLEEIFWRNFFLRCNSVRIAEGLPSYLPEVRSKPMSTGPFAMFRRKVFTKKKPLDFMSVGRTTNLERNITTVKEDNLSDLELDVDGEIEKELVKRRPSRAIETNLQPLSSIHAVAVEKSASVEADKSVLVPVGEVKSMDPENTPDANSPNLVAQC